MRQTHFFVKDFRKFKDEYFENKASASKILQERKETVLVSFQNWVLDLKNKITFLDTFPKKNSKNSFMDRYLKKPS